MEVCACVRGAISICEMMKLRTAHVLSQAEKELRELNRWVKGCLEDLASQRPLADTLEGVKVQKQWYQVRVGYSFN